MRLRIMLELPVLCSLITGALMIGVHTINWVEIVGNPGKDRPEFTSAPLMETHFIAHYCSGCHHAGRSGIDFDEELLTLEAMRSEPAVWRQVVEKLRSHAMPPRGFPQPTAREREFAISWLEQEVLHERHFPSADRFMARRLQRTEYLNSVRDLLGIRPNSELDLPKDETAWRQCNRFPEASEHRKQYHLAAEMLLDQAMASDLDLDSLDGEPGTSDWRALEDPPLLFSACACRPSAEAAREILDGFAH